MSHDTHVDIKSHVRKYLVVFATLLGLTFVTVIVSTFHLSVRGAIAVALVVATVKGSLVASYFMHLISEKKLIFFILILTAVFFIALMALPISHWADNPGLH